MSDGRLTPASDAAPAARPVARDRRRPVLMVAALLLVLAAAPFAVNLAGDAQVHLAIAESFAGGRPFQYNPDGEIVVASTSPFWTMLLALFFRVAGPLTPALLSAVAVVFWLSAGYVLYRSARDLWGFHGPSLGTVVALWFGHTTIVANSLGGLENVAGALQLLLLYYLLANGRRWTPDAGMQLAEVLPVWRAIGMGVVLGWALLTRPDSGLFALLLIFLALPTILIAGRGAWQAVRGLLLIALAAAIILLPWFAYQYAVTGNLLTDSSMARLYNGRMGSLMIIPDLLYFHPKALISLSTAFLPLVFGFLIAAGDLAAKFLRQKTDRLALYRRLFPQVAAVLLVLGGLVFYTFIVGAEAFGRYFLPLFPFFFLSGVAGLVRVYNYLSAFGGRRLGVTVVALIALFIAGTSALDYYRRLGPGRFMPERALDVIYGPANLRYYAPNMPLLVSVPAHRREYTDEFLSDLGAPETARPAIAVTEVQLRYFLDDRVTVLSLDGRTSADILAYVNPTTGVPDFEAYFRDARPDYVHANQWCEVGGWLASVFPSSIEGNLVCEWERQTERMTLGDSFAWQGQTVTLVAPEILRIDWPDP